MSTLDNFDDSLNCPFCPDVFPDQKSLDAHIRNKHDKQEDDGVAVVSPDESVDLSPLDADVQRAVGVADGVVALTSWLKQELVVLDGGIIPNQEDALTSFRDAFADVVDSGVLENVEFPDDVASTSQEELDPESLKRAHFAILASAALNLKGKVDLDPNAENSYVTCAKNWFKRVEVTLLPDESVPLVEQALQNVDGVADVSPDERVPLVEQALPIVDGVAEIAPSAAASETRAPPPASDRVAALTSWLKQELVVLDGGIIPNQEDALTSFRDAFADVVDSGVLENVEFPDDVASTSQEELDPESLKRAHFAILASAALNLKGKVDLDPNAENSYVTCAKNWFKRAEVTLLPDESVPLVEQALQNVDGVADVSPDERVPLVEQALPIVDGVAEIAPSAAASETRAPPPASDRVAALNSWLKQELVVLDGGIIPNQEDALTSFRDAFADVVDSGVLENVEFPDDVASTSQEELDPESLKRAHFAILASAALNLKGKVDLDTNAENSYVTCAKNWFKRAEVTLLPDESVPLVEQALQNVDGVADVSPDERVPLVEQALPIVDGVAEIAPSAAV